MITNNFGTAIERVFLFEGEALSNDKDDLGGQSKYGISKRWYPGLDIESLTRAQAIEIYRVEYWDRYRIKNIPSPFQVKIFDMIVNIGYKPTIICLQRALQAVSMNVIDDGILGPQTRKAFKEATSNNFKSFGLQAALKAEHAAHYRALASNNPSQRKFLSGWLRRAYY